MNIQKITKTHLFPKGFTLIELIVVITILAILGTIGFLSIGGYSSKARDSARIGDVTQISKSLDLSIVTTGDYPTPDNSFAITYSGGVVWNQGTIGNNVLQVMKSSISGGGLNKKPTDPLTNKEYTYSELAEGKAYQIKVDYEGDLAQTALDTSLVNEATAAPGNPTIAYIRGNFGGLTAKTTVGSNVFILAIPSIMSNTGSTGVPIEIRGTTTLSGALLFHGQNLKSATNFNPNTVVFTGTIADTNKLGLPSTTTEITNMMTLLQSTYSGSNVRASQSVSSLIAMNTGALVDLWKTAVTVQLGGNGGGGGQQEQITPVQCSPGTYSANGNTPCTTASAGFFASSTGATTQSQCPANSYCPTGTGTPIACTGGATSPAGSTNSAQCSLYTFTSHTFSNCGATGRNGPSLASCQSSYAGQSWAQNTTFYSQGTYQGYQLWTVPATGIYRIVTRGATGKSANYTAGYGAVMQGDFSLNLGDKLIITVGQMGVSNNGSDPHGNENGGGGGTFVVNQSGNTPLIVAGGGGGSPSSTYGISCTQDRASHGDASITTSGKNISCSSSANGGTSGAGGQAAGSYQGGAGGGFSSVGTNGGSHCSQSYGGNAFNNGLVGGVGGGCYSVNSDGGFGGGGGGSLGGPGAGGGYSGGASAASWSSYSTFGGGGGSYNIGSNPSNSVGNNTHGSVVITKL